MSEMPDKLAICVDMAPCAADGEAAPAAFYPRCTLIGQ
jgi:hypothetical protein